MTASRSHGSLCTRIFLIASVCCCCICWTEKAYCALVIDGGTHIMGGLYEADSISIINGATIYVDPDIGWISFEVDDTIYLEEGTNIITSHASNPISFSLPHYNEPIEPVGSGVESSAAIILSTTNNFINIDGIFSSIVDDGSISGNTSFYSSSISIIGGQSSTGGDSEPFPFISSRIVSTSNGFREVMVSRNDRYTASNSAAADITVNALDGSGYFAAQAVPVPSTLILLGPALTGMMAMLKRRRGRIG